MATAGSLGCCMSLATVLFCGDFPESPWEGNSMFYIGSICIRLLTALITRSCANRVRLCSLAEISWTLFLPLDVLLRPLCLAGIKQ